MSDVIDFILRYVGLFTSTYIVGYLAYHTRPAECIIFAFVILFTTLTSNIFYYNMGRKGDTL
jgi:hypothetical protein